MNSHNFPDAWERWMITLTIMLVAIIEVLDMTIVNVSLPTMMGALGATSEQITWVLTSYIVTSAIMMLLTGFIDARLGRQKLLLISIMGFIIASVCCGIATNLTEIVIFRGLQGFFGGSLVPLSQTILRSTFPLEEQGKAMAIWGIGIMAAPILGPTLGGFINEHFGWRWVFFINAPICAISFFMTLRFIKDTEKVFKKIDWYGAAFMAIGVGSLQLFLDQGNSHSWFESKFITGLAITAVIFLMLFIIRSLKNPDSILNLRLFKDRNFAFATGMMTVFCISAMGIIAIQPILLENYFGYPPEFTGLVMAPRGIASALAMALAGILVNKIDPRKIMFCALLFSIAGSFMVCSYDLNVSPLYWVLSGLMQGFGTGLFLIPLATLSLSASDPKDTAAKSGLFSFGRNLGSSIGISILSTILTRQTQISWNSLSGYINPFNPNLHLWLDHQGWHMHSVLALSQLQQIVGTQAGMMAYIDTFWLIGLSLIILLPCVFLIKKPSLLSKTREAVH